MNIGDTVYSDFYKCFGKVHFIGNEYIGIRLVSGDKEVTKTLFTPKKRWRVILVTK